MELFKYLLLTFTGCQAMARRKTSSQAVDSTYTNHRSTRQQTSIIQRKPGSAYSTATCTPTALSPQSSNKSLLTDSKSSVAPKLTQSTVYTTSASVAVIVMAVITLYLAPSSIQSYYESSLGYFFPREDPYGGWRPATEEIIQKYNTDVCNIQRLSVIYLTPKRFEEDFRFKKPVLVTFPNGIRDWTDPYLWSRNGLLKAYSNWTMHSGQSLEIVRAGGNARHKTTFAEFVEKLLGETNHTTEEPLHYGFDRRFYYDTDLPNSLRLPVYFQTNHSLDDSIFFLGSSLTGVVFHKHSDTWNAVLYGKKRWFLYPTTKTPPGGVYHGFTLLDWFHNVYPMLSEFEKPIECVQQGGEILYLPEGMYHATLNLGDTVAVAIQKKNATIESETLSYEATWLNNMVSETDDDDAKKAYTTRLKEIYERTVELLPENAEGHHKLGLALFTMGMYHGALARFMKAIKLDPYFVLAYIHMAKSLSKLHDYQKAEIVFKKALEISPNLWDNYKEYGEFLLQQGRPAHALPIYKRGTELMPEFIPFWHYYKHCQTQLGDKEGAEESEQVITRLQRKKRLSDS